jgi:hypothetical protein
VVVVVVAEAAAVDVASPNGRTTVTERSLSGQNPGTRVYAGTSTCTDEKKKKKL